MLPYFTFLPYFATYFYSSRSSTLLKLFLNHVTYLLHWLDVRLRTVLCSHPWSKFSRSLLIPAAAVWLAGRTDMGSAWTGRAKWTCRFWFSLVAVRSTTAIVRTKNKQSRNPAWNEATLNRIAGSKSMTIALLIYSVTFVLSAVWCCHLQINYKIVVCGTTTFIDRGCAIPTLATCT